MAVPIKEQLRSLVVVHSQCSIYAVPENLRQVNPDAYRPLLLSIGPVHCRDPRVSDMHQQKLRYLQSFLERYPKYDFDEYLSFAKGWVETARKTYIETIDLPSSGEVFAEMLLLDAAFIIELLMRYFSHGQSDPVIRVGSDDRVLMKPRMIAEVVRDIRLEENQLPFFVIVQLYKRATESSIPRHPHPPLLDAVCRLFQLDRVSQGMDVDGIEHLVGFLRECYLPTQRRSSATRFQNLEFSMSVTKLREAGVRFVVGGENANLLDVRFNRGVLTIPRLTVADDTESLFRNMIAFEQCHHYYDSYIIDYIALLNSLISTGEDVEVLVKRGIVVNWLGNNDVVANMFSNLFRETRLCGPNFYYSGICRELNAYAKSRTHRWMAILKRKYFSHPWAFMAVLYATLIFILTVLQVVSGFK